MSGAAQPWKKGCFALGVEMKWFFQTAHNSGQLLNFPSRRGMSWICFWQMGRQGKIVFKPKSWIHG